MVKRIIGSKKVILSVIGVLTNAAASFLGFDPSEGVLAIANAAFALLIGGQVLIDAIQGSPSDKNGS